MYALPPISSHFTLPTILRIRRRALTEVQLGACNSLSRDCLTIWGRRDPSPSSRQQRVSISPVIAATSSSFCPCEFPGLHAAQWLCLFRVQRTGWQEMEMKTYFILDMERERERCDIRVQRPCPHGQSVVVSVPSLNHDSTGVVVTGTHSFTNPWNRSVHQDQERCATHLGNAWVSDLTAVLHISCWGGVYAKSLDRKLQR